MGRRLNPKPVKKIITRYESPDGKRATKDTPKARKVTTTSDTYYVCLPDLDTRKPVYHSLGTPDLQVAWHRLQQVLQDRKNRELGILDDASVQASRPIADHIADWLASLNHSGTTPKQVRQVGVRVSKLSDLAGFSRIADIRRSAVQAALSRMQTDNDISAQTRNHYLSHIHQFCRWLVEENRIKTDPLAGLSGVSVEGDRRHDRRIPTDEEIQILFDHLDDAAPKRKGMSGSCRALAYQTAMVSGLRANELRSLEWSSFNLETGTIRIRAVDAKNRKRTVQTIPSWLAEKLQTYKDAGGILWSRFPADYPGRLLKADLLAARTAWIDQADGPKERLHREQSTLCQHQTDGPDGPLFLDFHSLRHWYVTQVAGLEGISPSTMQSLVRHSDPRLTMKVYAKTKEGQVRSTVDRITLPTKKR